MQTNKIGHIIGSVARTLLALTFLFSGFVKAVDPLGTVYKIEDYLKAFGGFFTDLLPLAELAAIGLIMAECVLGVCMLLNIRTQWTSWLSLAFYLFMTPLTLWIALTNPVSDCGCFGDALVLTNWQTFWKNIVLLSLVIILLVCRKAIPGTFGWKTELAVALLAAAASFGLMEYTWRHLPLMDFRPYKVGNNIPALMEIPEGAEPDVYETTLIYEKDGRRQSFTLDNYPKGDPSWTFVDQRSVLVKKGYEAPIHDFEILTMDYEDITYDILESEEPVTLVIMYDLKKADRKQAAKAFRLFEESTSLPFRAEIGSFYFLTGSGEDDIYAFGEELGWDEETIQATFCTCDPVTLKTIVRANPGIVVLQSGTIIAKHNLRQL
ncbi:MAG: DoxX family protein [Paludibacteraceae bacterium]|nr:DoxX family protein [Paludibacteraceae bacterium]